MTIPMSCTWNRLNLAYNPACAFSDYYNCPIPQNSTLFKSRSARGRWTPTITTDRSIKEPARRWRSRPRSIAKVGFISADGILQGSYRARPGIFNRIQIRGNGRGLFPCAIPHRYNSLTASSPHIHFLPSIPAVNSCIHSIIIWSGRKMRLITYIGDRSFAHNGFVIGERPQLRGKAGYCCLKFGKGDNARSRTPSA